MFISDIGQDLVEEIDVGRRGANYGWSEREGTVIPDRLFPKTFELLPRYDPFNGFRYPAAQYDHDDGFAVIAGFVARGGGVPALEGQYVFGDNNGRIFYANAGRLVLRDAIAGRFGSVLAARSPIHELRVFHEGVETTLLAIIGEFRRADLRFGQGEDGTVYVLTKRDGMIRAIRPLACDDGSDNDGDGLVDLLDPECTAVDDPAEACGLGFELVLLVPLLARLRARRRQSAAGASDGSRSRSSTSRLEGSRIATM